MLAEMRERTARWYYFSAVANEGAGNKANALNYAKQAVDMEPGNTEYCDYLDRLQYGGNWLVASVSNYGSSRFYVTVSAAADCDYRLRGS